MCCDWGVISVKTNSYVVCFNVTDHSTYKLKTVQTRTMEETFIQLQQTYEYVNTPILKGLPKQK